MSKVWTDDEIAAYAPIAAERARARERDRLKTGLPQNPFDWAVRYRRPHGRPFSLERFPSLEQIYRDTHLNAVIIKPAQRGLSEYACTVVLWLADVGADVLLNGDKDGLNIGYLFPKERQLQDFSRERFGMRLPRETEHIKQLMDADSETLMFKIIGNSVLYLRGVQSIPGMLSWPADAVIEDEYDQFTDHQDALADARMEASPLRFKRRFSTPGLPDTGIHRAYKSSDQHEYETQCQTCLEYQCFDFHRDVYVIDEDDVSPVPFEVWKSRDPNDVLKSDCFIRCPNCLSTVDPMGPSRWVSRNPRSPIRGYWVPWWPWPMLRLYELCAQAASGNPEQEKELYRSKLGIPYAPKDAALTPEAIHALIGTPEQLKGPYRQITMGIDVNKRGLFWRVSALGQAEKRRIVLGMGKTSTDEIGKWQELDSVIKRFRPWRMVIDIRPEESKTAEFQQMHGVRAYRAEYHTRGMPTLYTVNEKIRHVIIDRNAAHAEVWTTLTNGEEIWPREVALDPEVVSHMCAPKRVVKEDEQGREVQRWEHTTADDYFSATIYDLIAAQVAPVRARRGGSLLQATVKSQFTVRTR